MVSASTLKYLIFGCLSYAVVVGAAILKVPQILKVARSGKAEGISLFSLYLELLSCVISTSWGVVQGLPFRDFGENVFIFAQLILLVLLVAKLQRKARSACVALAAELLMLYVLAAGHVPVGVHRTLLSGQIFLNMSSRVPQIVVNHRTRCQGQLSFLTFFLAFGGGVARVMTTAVNVPWEKGKGVMLLQFGVAAMLNAIILTQMMYYQLRKDKKGYAELPSGKRPSKKN